MIELHTKSYKLKLNNIDCTFMPIELYIGNNLYPEHRHVHKYKGYLFWVVNKKQVSYKKIKKAILKS